MVVHGQGQSTTTLVLIDICSYIATTTKTHQVLERLRSPKCVEPMVYMVPLCTNQPLSNSFQVTFYDVLHRTKLPSPVPALLAVLGPAVSGPRLVHELRELPYPEHRRDRRRGGGRPALQRLGAVRSWGERRRKGRRRSRSCTKTTTRAWDSKTHPNPYQMKWERKRKLQHRAVLAAWQVMVSA